jgi:2-isopropylmalate synthase
MKKNNNNDGNNQSHTDSYSELTKDSGFVRIFDTTLRDGEQTPGVSLTPDQKLEIALKLDELGVNTIEAGFPITSQGEKLGVRKIAEAGLKAEICALSRASVEDIDVAVSCNVDALHIFIATSDLHLKYKLNLTRDQVIEKAVEAVTYAKAYGVVVEFSAEDATRTETNWLMDFFKAVDKAGADRLDIPDTVGTATPEQMSFLVNRLSTYCNKPISVHCHDDFGLATANTLASIKAGAAQAHVTVNGLGERAGNASLEEVVMSLHVLRHLRTSINQSLLYQTSRLVSKHTGVAVQPNKALVGENAFGHESGIHTHGILTMPLTYEPIDPETIGRRRWFQAGKHAGSHGIKAQLNFLNIHPNDSQLRDIVLLVKDLGDKGKRVTESDLISIARNVMGSESVLVGARQVRLVDIGVLTGTQVMPTASVRLEYEGKVIATTDNGVGPIDAAMKAIQKVSEKLGTIKLKEYRLDAISGGSDAVAEAYVTVEDSHGVIATATASNRDVVVASVEAMIRGINTILMKNNGFKLSHSVVKAALEPPGD